MTKKTDHKIFHHTYEFYQGIQGVLKKELPSKEWMIPLSIGAMFMALFIWLWLSETDIITVAQGKTIPSARMQLIQNEEIGVVDNIFVKEGDRVKAGEKLIAFQKKNAELEYDTLRSKYFIALTARRSEILFGKFLLGKTHDHWIFEEEVPYKYIAREKLLLSNRIDVYNAQLEMYDSKNEQAQKRLESTKQELAMMRETLPFSQKRVDSLEPLVAQGLESQAALDERLEELINKKGEIGLAQARIGELETEIAIQKNELQLFKQQAMEENTYKVTDLLKEVNELHYEMSIAKNTLDSKILYAKMDGIVNNLNVFTIGGVVQPSEVIMQIIPNEGVLQVEVNVLNKDIGFIKEGQNVKVKFDSFSYTKYGYLEGKVREIETASKTDEKLGDIYPVIIKLSQDYLNVDGEDKKLIPGMTASVDIILGERSIMEYIFSPFLRYKDEALKER